MHRSDDAECLDGAASEYAIDEDDDGLAIALDEILEALNLSSNRTSLISNSAPRGSRPRAMRSAGFDGRVVDVVGNSPTSEPALRRFRLQRYIAMIARSFPFP